MFMTAVCTAFLLTSDNAFGLPSRIGYAAAVAVFILSGILFAIWRNKTYGKLTDNNNA